VNLCLIRIIEYVSYLKAKSNVFLSISSINIYQYNIPLNKNNRFNNIRCACLVQHNLNIIRTMFGFVNFSLSNNTIGLLKSVVSDINIVQCENICE